MELVYIALVVFGLFFISALWIQKTNKKIEEEKFEEFKTAVNEEVSKINETYSDEPIEEHTERIYVDISITKRLDEIQVKEREPREIKEKRMNDTRTMLTIRVYLFRVMDYLSARSFYDLRKSIPGVIESLDEYKNLLNYPNLKECRKQAIKEFCGQNHLRRLPVEYKEWMQSPFEIKIDIAEAYKKMSYIYKEYWNDVLDSYAMGYAKVNRLEYLVDSMTNEYNNELIKDNDEAKSVINEIKIYYKSILTKELSSLWILKARKAKQKKTRKKKVSIT